MSKNHTWSYILTAVVLMVPQAIGAQGTVTQAGRSSGTPSSSATSTSSWSYKTSFSTKAEFDNNVYLASSKGRSAIDASGAATGGRYTEMSSASDVITVIRAGVELEGNGIGGRPLSVTPRAAYDYYTQNAARRNAQMDLTIAQALGNGSELRVRGAVTPRAFFKNYMIDAVDRNGDGTIAADERQYAAADFREAEAGADYRMRLNKSTAKSPMGATVRMGAGYYTRSYETRFAGRDLKGPTANADLVVSATRDLRFTLGYDFGALSGTATPTVVLLDEAAYGQDFNGNGTRSDVKVRSVQMVDRSRNEQQAALKAQTSVGRRTDLELAYARRWRSFGSTQPFDVANNGRNDARDEVGAQLQIRLSKPMLLSLGTQASSQRLDRPLDSGASGEVDDYSRIRGSLGLSYRF